MLALVRTVALTAVASVVAVAVYVASTAVGNGLVGGRVSSGTADAIVVMGAAQYDGVPSPMLEGRLAAALALWNEGRAPLVAVTGGKQESDRFTEASTSRRWLIDRGVPADAIVFEDAGRSTWESLSLLAPVLRGNDVDSVIVVTDGWHVPRSVQSARELGFSAVGSAVVREGFVWEGSRSLREALGVAAGRVIGFGRLLDITG